MFYRFTSLIIVIFFLAIPLRSENTIDDILDGFDDNKVAESIYIPETNSMSRKDDFDLSKIFIFKGSLSGLSSFNIAHNKPLPGQPDHRNISKLKIKLFGELKTKLSDQTYLFSSFSAFRDFAYDLNGRKNLSKAYLEEYEQELEFREAFINTELADWAQLTFGRQYLISGKADNVRVVDILNPLDLQEPGISDIRDLRLPLTATRFDFFISQFTVSLIMIHEIRFNKMPLLGSDFYPVPVLLPKENIPSSTAKNTEYAAEISGVFSGWDLGIHYASVYDDNFYFKVNPQLNPSVTLEHPRIQMGGLSFNIAKGNLLVRSELAGIQGLRFTSQGNTDFYRFDSMVGADFSKIKNTLISLELLNQHMFDYVNVMEKIDNVREDSFTYALRWQTDLLREKLHLSAVSSFFGIELDGGGLLRISTGYDLQDALDLVLGGIIYYSGYAKGFANIDDNDRLFLNITYGF